MKRRTFLVGGAALTVGVFILSDCNGHRVVIDRLEDGEVVLRPNAYVRLFGDGRISIVLARNEMGQGVYTTLPVLIAEELGVAPSSIAVKFAGVDAAYKNPSLFVQLTGGSRSTRSSFDPLRQLGAAVREALHEAAARALQVPVSNIEQRDRTFHDVADPSRQVAMGELLETAGRIVKARGTPKPRSRWRSLGRSQARLDAPAKVFGEAQFGVDVRMPGLRYASLWRRLRREDADDVVTRLKEEAKPGLQVIEPESLAAIDASHATVAVVGSDTWGPMSLIRKAQSTWGANLLGGYNAWTSTTLEQALETGLDETEAAAARNDGDFTSASADDVIKARFRFPYLPHLTMEPMNCTAWVKPTSEDSGAPLVELWVPSQAPYGAVRRASELTGVEEDRIRFHQTFIGGGFGRRAENDFVVEAVVLSKAIGAPVKVTWSREDDIRHGRYRPASHHDVEVKLKDRRIVGWRHRVSGPSLSAQFTPGFIKDVAPFLPNFVGDTMGVLAKRGGSADTIAVQTAEDLPYDIDNVLVEHALNDAGVPLSYWRANGSNTNGFVIETVVDEIAERIGEDPIAFRRRLLAKHPRYLAAIDAVTEIAASSKAQAGRARGFAVVETYDSIVAMIAEVSVDESLRPRVHRVFVGVDCGTALDPGVVEQQMESGVIFGMSAALHGNMTWAAGIPEQSNFHDHPVVRLHESPIVQTAIVPSTAPPTGVGEPSVSALAPALANGLRRLGVASVRSLPMKLHT